MPTEARFDNQEGIVMMVKVKFWYTKFGVRLVSRSTSSMAAPDARTRNKVVLNSHRVRSSSIPTNKLPTIFLSNVLFALALHAGKEWLLNFDVGIFWVTLRVLAFGGLAVLIKEGFTGELWNKKSIEACASFLPFRM